MHSLLAQSGIPSPLIALAVIVAGFIIGSISAAIARKIAGRESQPEVIRTSEGAIATLFFSMALIASLIIALGIVNEQALDQLLTDSALFLPKVISAAIVVIVGNIFANLAEAGVLRSLGHVSATLRQRVPMAIKAVIVGFSAIIAANQLGVNTTIVLITVAALLGGIALAAALLAGLGGRAVAQEVAAGRAIRRELKVGDTIRVGQIEGEIAAIGSTSTQLTSANDVHLVPNAQLLSEWVQVLGEGPSISLAPPLDPEE